MISCISFIVITSCSKDDKNEKAPESIEESYIIETTAQVIRNSGLEFPSISSANREASRPMEFIWPAEDYITVTREREDGDYGEIITVNLWLGPDNHIIPTPDWQRAHPDYCLDQGKYMRPVRKLLQFRIFNNPRDDIRAVQLNRIDVETGRIENSFYTDYYDADPNWMHEAMSEAWDQLLLESTIKGAVDPCDTRVPLTLHFTSTVNNVTEDNETYEKIEATVTLHFDESIGGYTGSAEFVWIEGWIYIAELNETRPYPPEKNGALEIVKLITPAMVENSIEDATMEFKAPRISATTQSMLFASFMAFYDMIHGDNTTITYQLNNWQLLADPEIIMAKYLNHVLDDGETRLTENTIFEIVQ